MSIFRQHLNTGRRFLGRLSLAGVHLLIAVVFGWLALRLFPGDRWMPVRLVSYFAPWLFIALIPALLVPLLQGRRKSSGLVLLLLVGFVAIYWPLFAPRQPAAYAGATQPQLKVMSFNVNLNNTNAAGVAALIRAEQPEIIAFQELLPPLANRLQPELAASHPYFLVDNDWGLPMVVASRYPLRPLPKPNGARRAQHVLVDTPQGEIVVWNVHPNPAVTGGWESQRALLTAVAGEVAEEARPVLVMGDFNATDQSENYRLIAAQLSDTHRAAGQGFGFTFPDFAKARADHQQLPWYVAPLLQVPPVVKIDHIFASRHFRPLRSYIVPNAAGSDHRPLLAELSATWQ